MKKGLSAAWLPGVLAVLVMIGAWSIAARRFAPDQLPDPWLVGRALRELLVTGALLRHTGVSLLRFAIAYVLASVICIPLGLLLGWYSLPQRAVGPLIQILRPISPIAWFPLAVLWFGIGDAPAVFIIFVSAAFPITLSAMAAMKNVPETYLRVADNFGLSRAMLFFQIIIPASFPLIMNGLRLAAGAAWIHLVAGEMLGAQSGLGFLIMDARNFLRTDLLLAAMVTIGVLGLGMDQIMSVTERTIRRRWGLADAR
jgi:NitT/TauT family transport system permease protein